MGSESIAKFHVVKCTIGASRLHMKVNAIAWLRDDEVHTLGFSTEIMR